MFKLLLVDDKKDIVNGIAGAVDWKEKGVEVVCFYNGKDALEYILESPPDIVITDINMPFLSGLELVKEASAIHSDIRFIVLTGYDEFSYAREALHLGVVEYLSKPVPIEVIVELVTKEKKRLEELKKKKRDLVDIRIKFNQSLPYMKSRWFHSFISEKPNVSEMELKEIFNEMEISLGTRYFTVVLIEHDMAFQETKIIENSENKLLLYAIENIAKELVGGYRPCEVFQCNENRLALLINYNHKNNSIVNHYELYSHLTSLRKNFNEFFKSTISIGMGECYEEINGIIKSYEEAKEALSHKFYFGNNSIISIHDVSKEGNQNQILYPKEMEDVIIRSIKQGDEEEASQNLERYFNLLFETKNAIPSKIRKQMINFLLKVRNECSVEQNIHIMDLLDEFRQFVTLEDLKEWFLSYAKYLCEKQDVNNTGIKKEILKIKEYIDLHYAETITLKKMADYIFISQSYLSFTFKEIMKINFNEYLTRVRMERAKELLSSSKYKVYEVCELVGYSDKKYFSDLFKKHTGVLPSEWGRKEITDGNQTNNQPGMAEDDL